jgi:hypothetical protein
MNCDLNNFIVFLSTIYYIMDGRIYSPEKGKFVSLKTKHGQKVLKNYNEHRVGGDKHQNCAYCKIVNPQTGKLVSTYGQTGGRVIRDYVEQEGGKFKYIWFKKDRDDNDIDIDILVYSGHSRIIFGKSQNNHEYKLKQIYRNKDSHFLIYKITGFMGKSVEYSRYSEPILIDINGVNDYKVTYCYQKFNGFESGNNEITLHDFTKKVLKNTITGKLANPNDVIPDYTREFSFNKCVKEMEGPTNQKNIYESTLAPVSPLPAENAIPTPPAPTPPAPAPTPTPPPAPPPPAIHEVELAKSDVLSNNILFSGGDSTDKTVQIETYQYFTTLPPDTVISIYAMYSPLTINGNNFSYKCFIGRGGMGQVCSYMYDNRRLAVKEDKSNLHSEYAHLNIEASILLNRKNMKQHVIPFIRNNNFIIMPEITVLNDFITTYTPSFKTKILILCRIIYCINELASKGLYYTDLKMINVGIIFTSEYRIKCFLIDIGSISEAGQMTITTGIFSDETKESKERTILTTIKHLCHDLFTPEDIPNDKPVDIPKYIIELQNKFERFNGIHAYLDELYILAFRYETKIIKDGNAKVRNAEKRKANAEAVAVAEAQAAANAEAEARRAAEAAANAEAEARRAAEAAANAEAEAASKAEAAERKAVARRKATSKAAGNVAKAVINAVVAKAAKANAEAKAAANAEAVARNAAKAAARNATKAVANAKAAANAAKAAKAAKVAKVKRNVNEALNSNDWKNMSKVIRDVNITTSNILEDNTNFQNKLVKLSTLRNKKKRVYNRKMATAVERVKEVGRLATNLSTLGEEQQMEAIKKIKNKLSELTSLTSAGTHEWNSDNLEFKTNLLNIIKGLQQLNIKKLNLNAQRKVSSTSNAHKSVHSIYIIMENLRLLKDEELINEFNQLKI